MRLSWDLGINGFSWKTKNNVLEQEAKHVSELGFKYVYGDGLQWDNKILKWGQKIFCDFGLSVFSIHTPFGFKIL